MCKRIHWVSAAVMSLFSPALFALGLGGAVVESYLDQPLDVRVELIGQSGKELQSITAGLASADDFELLGLSRAAITVPLEFELVTDTAQPYIHITSDLKINEPVVQVLVEVVWASGRMLREYTLFLDPPTIDSPAPPVTVKPTPQPAPVEAVTVDTTRTSATAIQPAPVPEAQEPSSEGQFSDDDYGPVVRGETLWGIARDFSKGTGYSINQAMLAFQRKNPEAFIRDNINSLKRGAILRLPAFNEIGELASREAMLEVMRQEQEFQAGTRSVAPDFNTPTLADSGDYQESVVEQAPEPVTEEDAGHLELVPPVEQEDQESLLPEPDVSTQLIQEELSRTEEELVNAQQENSYLTQRIQELEAEAKAQTDKSVSVEDSGLAKLESNLAQERSSDQAEPQVAITPGGEKQAWYAGKTGLISAFAVALIALIVWGLWRRSAARLESEQTETMQAITVEAENKTVEQISPEPEPLPEPEPESEPEPEPAPTPAFVMGPEDDERGSEDDDPEIKLDLARAYLSLGDKEASKSMLDEVLKNGNEAQKAEARQMMDEL